MKYLLFIVFLMPFTSSADCGFAYSYNQNMEYSGKVKRQESPREKGVCWIPRNSVLVEPVLHKWKTTKWDGTKWINVDPDIGGNPDPEIYVRVVDPETGPKWEKDPGLIAVKEAKEKAIEEAKKEREEASKKKAQEQKNEWDSICVNTETRLENILCKERGY